MKALQECRCCGETTRVRVRDFSPQAWAFLLHWKEVDISLIGKPICLSCYNDLRELLIERSAEIEGSISPEVLAQLPVVADALAGRIEEPQIAS